MFPIDKRKIKIAKKINMIGRTDMEGFRNALSRKEFKKELSEAGAL